MTEIRINFGCVGATTAPLKVINDIVEVLELGFKRKELSDFVVTIGDFEDADAQPLIYKEQTIEDEEHETKTA